MSRTISRIGVGIAASALVFGATFAVAGSAMADTTPTPTPLGTASPVVPTLDSKTTTFAAGNWGAGITATGSGFTSFTDGDPIPDTATFTVVAFSGPFDGATSAVDELKSQTQSLADETPLLDLPAGFTVYGETPVVPDASGNFQVTNWVPEKLATPLPDGNRAILAVIVDVDGNPATAGEGDIIGIAGPFLDITPFVPLAQAITITPTCSTPDGAFTEGIDVVATGFGQGEAVTDSTGAADGSTVGDVVSDKADLTGTYRGHFTLLTQSSDGTNSPIAAGDYNETVTGANGLVLTTSFTVGDCTVPAAVVTAPALANTGSGDTGILVGGSALLLLIGGALVVARRRTVAAK